MEKQANHATEATAALHGNHKSLNLVYDLVEGATIARIWISSGGPQSFLRNDGINATDFITAVGAQYLEGGYGTSLGTAETASTTYFSGSCAEFLARIARDARQAIGLMMWVPLSR